MDKFRFDGKVVVITGAGRGLGLGYAEYLAKLGAAVVVNDLGGGVAGDGSDASVAESVAQAIRADGGSAIASSADIACESGASSLVQAAVSEFGHLDAVINNAGITAGHQFPEISVADVQRHLDVHVMGTFLVTRAAWPHLAKSSSGRVLNTISGAIFGSAPALPYTTAKGAVLGMTKALAEAGAPLGIKVNGISPSAKTRMIGLAENRRGIDWPDDVPMLARHTMDVAPVAAYLVHERCPVSGQFFFADSGRVAHLVLGETRGGVADDRTVESIHGMWDRVLDADGFVTPASTVEHRKLADEVLAEARGID